MDCKTISAPEFRTRLGVQQYDVILTKEQSVLRKTMSSFEGENLKTQYSVLSYRICSCFQDYKLAIDIDENEHSGRIIIHEIKRQKGIEQELDYKFIRIYHDKKDFDNFGTINEIFTPIKQLTKKTLIKKVSMGLLGRSLNQII